MQFANYDDFRTRTIKLILSDDGAHSPDALSVDMADFIIAAGETRVYLGSEDGVTGLRASTMLADLSLTVASNAVTLPADFLELKEIRFSGKRPLDIVPLDRLRTLEANAPQSGTTYYCAQDGDTLRFWPEASGTVLGRYYKRPADMATGTWATHTTVARYPELFIYAALAESAPFMGDDTRLPAWKAKFGGLLASAKSAEQWRVYGGSPLRIRSR